jgi:2-methylisocitrate lyase-like PEP mutase family enzyme
LRVRSEIVSAASQIFQAGEENDRKEPEVTSKAAQLRNLLNEPSMLVVVDCYSVLTARIVESEGVAATYCGGSAMGGMHYGLPDHGLLLASEMIEMAGRIASSVNIPLIADADQAGETSTNVRRTVREFEAAGVAGIHIEDTRNPKHLYDGDSLVPIAHMAARIEAAVDARKDDDFVIIARSDEIFNKGTVAETVRRGIAYAKAGADLYMVVGMKPDEIRQIAAEVPIPLVDIMHPVEVARDTGLKVNLMLGGDRFAAAAHRDFVRNVVRTGELLRPDEPLTRGDFADLVHDSDWDAEAKRWQRTLQQTL